MSTSCFIACKVKQADYDRVNEEFMKRMSDDCQVLSDDTPYMVIYCHMDGYPSHMLKELLEHFNSYEDVLRLVLKGFTSSISNGVSDSYAKDDEPYKEGDEPKVASSDLLHPDADIQYFYKYEDNHWIVTAYHDGTDDTESDNTDEA